MTQKKSSFTAPNGFEMLLVVLLFYHGGWQMNIAWDNPRHVGWIPSGTLLTIGSMACAWLIWQRRGAQRSTIVPMILVMNSSDLVKGILEWRAKKEGAEWPTTYCIFVALILALMIAEEINHRKQVALEAACESKIFSMEDSL
jgi:hypothetical protein